MKHDPQIHRVRRLSRLGGLHRKEPPPVKVPRTQPLRIVSKRDDES